MNINIQPIEKRAPSDGTHLEVHSIFYTIQGEGPFSGRPAVFIRLAGCNLQCPGCDTDYTSSRTFMDVETIVNTVESSYYKSEYWNPKTSNRPLVVITGGEPFRQNLTWLTDLLIAMRFTVQIETNGTLPPSPRLHDEIVIVCSPKTGRINPELRPRINAYKYVLHADSVVEHNGLPKLALGHPASPRVAAPLSYTDKVFMQPMDSKDPVQNQKNLDAVLQSCLKFGYTLQLQIHKLIGVE